MKEKLFTIQSVVQAECYLNMWTILNKTKKTGLADHLNNIFKQLEETTTPLLDGLCVHIDFRVLFGNDDTFASSLLSADATFIRDIEEIDKTVTTGHCIPYLIAYPLQDQQVE